MSLIGRTATGLVYVEPLNDEWRLAFERLAEEAMAEQSIVPMKLIANRIQLIRGESVMLDNDLADLYGVTVSAINQAVKRNPNRFPTDFVFQLESDESTNLKSQSVISSSHGGRRRSRPYAFTEQGVAMLSSVLRSERAVQVNVAIMRAFVQLRRMLMGNEELSRKLATMEKRYDAQFKGVFDAIRALMSDEDERKKRPKIGYQ